MSYDANTHTARVSAVRDNNGHCYWLHSHADMVDLTKACRYPTGRTLTIANARPAYNGLPVNVARDETHWAQLLILCGANGYELEELVV